MTVALGIDTGGTYTDAAIVDQVTGRVLAAAKALTTRGDLSIGIQQAISGSLAGKHQPFCREDITIVALSTTLATNAIAEGIGGKVCLLLIGYDINVMRKNAFERDLPTEDIVYLDGGHDIKGNEVTPLDEEAARLAILARRKEVEAFAISGYFGIRNTTHELRVRALVEELTDLPVTCANELTIHLNAVQRAVTVTLNAQLIPLLRDLVTKVGETLRRFSIHAPLMVVKGDGSLVRAEWAGRRPVETILSGPAASVVGACHLSGQHNAWVVDMGGTTTDIASVREGLPHVRLEGARVGGRRTMVEAIDVHTVGLGGDSHVYFNREGKMLLGPRRVTPLCLLGKEFPTIRENLRRQIALDLRGEGLAQFAIPSLRPANHPSSEDALLLSSMKNNPLPLRRRKIRFDWMMWRRIERMESEGSVQRSGFTPTDALHVLGLLQLWDAEAAKFGAEILAAQAGISVKTLCRRVVQQVSYSIGKAVISKILEEKEKRLPLWDQEPTAEALLKLALLDTVDDEFVWDVTLQRPLVAIGAPANAYLPRTAERLHAELTIPRHAEVANAVGAVVGSVVQRLEVLISPLDGGSRFRVHLPDGIRDFAELEKAVCYAQKTLTPQVKMLAQSAGADQTEVKMQRKDRMGTSDLGWIQEIHLDTKLVFTAVSRPRQAKRVLK
jgi:N-methylhydantoinase A/oxoprolinase/acetone carboxylase beta subunit